MHLDEWLHGRRRFAVIDGAAELDAVANLDPRIAGIDLLVEHAANPIVAEVFLPVIAAGHRESMPEAVFVAPPDHMLRVEGQRRGVIAQRAEVGPGVAAVLRRVKLGPDGEIEVRNIYHLLFKGEAGRFAAIAVREIIPM